MGSKSTEITDWGDGGNWSAQKTCVLSVVAHHDRCCSAYIDEITGDLNVLGELGESVYGEKADMRLLFGEGSIGDCSAIIVTSRA